MHKSRPRSHKPENLAVVCMVSNPMRWEKRYDLFEKFEKHIRSFTDNLTVVEIVAGGRTHQVTSKSNVMHVQLSTNDTNHCLWLKEAGWNIGAQRAPQESTSFCFLDTDIQFANPTWLDETLHALEMFPVVQPFASAVNLGPDGEFLDTWNSIGWAHQHHKSIGAVIGMEYSPFHHPGFCVAMRRETFSGLGGFMTHPILGSGDHHLFFALLGRVAESYPNAVHQNWKNLCLAFQTRADYHVGGRIGHTPGLVTHGFHGQFRNRRYTERWDIILHHNYDPLLDLTVDWQGLPSLTQRGMRLARDLHLYHQERREDDT